MINEIDKSNMYNVLKNFHKQISEAIDIGKNFYFSGFGIKSIKNIIINGLGGSAIGGDLVRSFTHYNTSIPININRNYHLPGFAGKNTLSIISSYSGNTEETNSAYSESINKGCRIICISSGGNVEKMAIKNKNLFVKIPGGLQPRCAIGYSFFILLIILSKFGFFQVKDSELNKVKENIRENADLFSAINNENNNALKIAKMMQNRLPIIYSSTDILDVVNLRWRGQIEENAKQLSYGNVYPEMNHNELVGWEKNRDILNKIIVVFLKDIDDNNRIKMRMEITEKIYRKYTDSVISIYGEGNSRLERIFNLIYLGDWISYHLAILNNVDPTPVDAITYLKEKLS
ncbi:MAG: bifunctional phosphoglucose/phosphomannose isomerase [Ignavibacteria bacterium]|nr:bifunctional phosphoglucose/phosphomannose isomerase [Ignavibacteria bacterium]